MSLFSSRLLKGLRPPVPFDDPYGSKGRWAEFARAQEIAWRTAHCAPPGWCERPQALQVAMLADLHVGSHTDDADRLIKIVSKINRRGPDIVLLLGDYVNMQPFGGGRIPPSVTSAILEELTAPLGVYAVLGNHDHDYGKERIAGALTQAGVTVLENASEVISSPKGDFVLIGLPALALNGSGLGALIDAAPKDMPGIIMAHDPAVFAHVPGGPYITVSGHTHGGQFRLPRIGPVVNSSRAPLRWSHGHIVENDRHLYVSSGIGTSVIPLRIGCPPEVNFVHLGGANGASEDEV
ncbi:MAG: metallophosphoesterase [Hyphomicrobiales bacterium]